MMTPALFLDRDGVMNIDKTYVYRFEDIEWVPGIFELIKWANEKKWKVIVLTNQSGIERKYYTKEDVQILHRQMTNFLAEKGLVIDDWFFSDSLTDERRKPSPQMMFEAQKKHALDLDQSVMVGDKESDVLHAKGPEYLLIKGKYVLDSIPHTVKIFNSLFEIVQYLDTRK